MCVDVGSHPCRTKLTGNASNSCARSGTEWCLISRCSQTNTARSQPLPSRRIQPWDEPHGVVTQDSFKLCSIKHTAFFQIVDVQGDMPFVRKICARQYLRHPNQFVQCCHCDNGCSNSRCHNRIVGDGRGGFLAGLARQDFCQILPSEDTLSQKGIVPPAWENVKRTLG